jgi:hypothetical protein
VPDTSFQQDYSVGLGFGAYLEQGFVIAEAAPGTRLYATNPERDAIGNGGDSGSKFMLAPPATLPTEHPPAGVPNSGISFERVDAMLFSVQSVRLAEYSQVFAFPVVIRLVGIQQGGVVEQLFSTDGLIDGSGGVPDFELVDLGPEFSDLLRFEILGLAGEGLVEAGAFAVDDVVYSVPEPTTAWLLFLGLGLAFRWLPSSGRPAAASRPAREVHRRVVESRPSRAFRSSG